jgi:hypothetical protein
LVIVQEVHALADMEDDLIEEGGGGSEKLVDVDGGVQVLHPVHAPAHLLDLPAQQPLDGAGMVDAP